MLDMVGKLLHRSSNMFFRGLSRVNFDHISVMLLTEVFGGDSFLVFDSFL